MNEGGTLTPPRQLKLLRKLYEEGKTIEVHTVEKTQDELSKELGITRQALSNHLKVLKELGYIRTGRGFIDLTEKALSSWVRRKGMSLSSLKSSRQRGSRSTTP